MNQSMPKRLNAIAQAIYDKKGMNILVLDVRGVCSMTDYFIIAEGTVDRHVKALADTVCDVLSKEKINPLHVEGQQEGDWIVLDFVDFIVHLFIPEMREKYRLEDLWKEGKVVDVKIEIPKVNPKLESHRSYNIITDTQ
ncbi:MAG: ribosome silencing factor [Parachlamydiaceae bacterium]|nr:ribosome silencing factor [Parachlamydiaceae bacterium]